MPSHLTIEDFARELESGAYAWPGGYPRYFLMSDGEALSFAAAEEMRAEIESAIADGFPAEWLPVAVEVNWEDSSLTCAHSGARIESAYAEGPEGENAPETALGSAYWASYLINGDDSGIDESERGLADAWRERLGEGADVVDVGEPYFSWSYGAVTGADARGGDLADYTILRRA